LIPIIVLPHSYFPAQNSIFLPESSYAALIRRLDERLDVVEDDVRNPLHDEPNTVLEGLVNYS